MLTSYKSYMQCNKIWVKLTHWGGDKMDVILHTFKINFHVWKLLYFALNFTENCSQGSNLQYVITGADNGLVANGR